MVREQSSQVLAETLEKVCRHWEKQRQSLGQGGEQPRAFTIALTREAGVDENGLAREITQRLHWPVYDRELLERIAKEMGLRTNLLETVDEKHVSWIRECVREIMAAITQVPTPGEDSYVHRLIETLLALGLHGECVIVGRGAAFVLPPASTLRVRLVAPRSVRLANWQRLHGVSHQEAERQVDELDRHRIAFLKNNFHKDPADPTNYDLILNAGRFSGSQCADLILLALDKIKKGDIPDI